MKPVIVFIYSTQYGVLMETLVFNVEDEEQREGRFTRKRSGIAEEEWDGGRGVGWRNRSGMGWVFGCWLVE